MPGKYDYLLPKRSFVTLKGFELPEEVTRELERLPPGRGVILELDGTSKEFMVMALEDFDHLCQLANVKRKQVPRD